MGYKIKGIFSVLVEFLLLFGLFFGISFALGHLGNIILFYSSLFAFSFIFLQYLIGPLVIGWIFRVRWVNYDDLKEINPNIYQIITETSKKYGFKFPKIGSIHDGNPNAFTFGWTRNSAHIVVTQGIIDLLDEDEQTAVIAHELGHICHRDFIVMAIVASIPMIAYYIYRILGRSSNILEPVKFFGRFKSFIGIIAIFAYIVYLFGYISSLFISRTREYWADKFSAEETGNANSLSKALVRISYGLTGGKKSSFFEQQNMEFISHKEEPVKQEKGFSRALALKSYGIADPKTSQNLLFSTAANSSNTVESIETAAAWDLYNPWARYFEIFGTHPLPAKRILALNKISKSQNIEPTIDLSKTKDLVGEQTRKKFLDEFIVGFIIYKLPWLIFYGGLIFSLFWVLNQIFNGIYTLGVLNLWIFWAWTLFFIGISKIIKTELKYRGGYKPMNIADCLKYINVNPIHPVPVIIEGTLIGRGIPGYILSKDMVIQDKTGFMRIDYRFGVKIVDAWWAITKINEYVGQEMKIYGWYRRAPGPYVQVNKIEVKIKSQRTHNESIINHRNYAKLMAYIGTFILWGIGLLLLHFFL